MNASQWKFNLQNLFRIRFKNLLLAIQNVIGNSDFEN